jgi:hypothetical protein
VSLFVAAPCAVWAVTSSETVMNAAVAMAEAIFRMANSWSV